MNLLQNFTPEVEIYSIDEAFLSLETRKKSLETLGFSTSPTDDNREMQEWATKTLERIFKEGYEYRKAGIILRGLFPAEKLSKRMFDDGKFE